jgi:hypothetical protein
MGEVLGGGSKGQRGRQHVVGADRPRFHFNILTLLPFNV